MPPKTTSLPAQSPYILFKRSRAASCGSGSSEPSSGSCFVANCQQPASSRALPHGIALAARPFWRWPGQRSPVAEVATAWPPAAVRQHINPGGRCTHPPTTSDAYCPFHTNRTNYPSQCSTSVPLQEGGGSQPTRCRPRASLDWTPGSTTPQRWKHDGVHNLADALSPVLIQAVRDTPRRQVDNEHTPQANRRRGPRSQPAGPGPGHGRSRDQDL
jgi:hypothetical protein